MLNWIRRRRQYRVGDLVEVTDGAYAGRTGVIVATTPDEAASDLFIDDCCRPRLRNEQLRRRGRGRGRHDVAAAIDASVNADEDALLSRSSSHSRSGGLM